MKVMAKQWPARQIVCICGSTRFRGQMAEVNRSLTMKGYIVVAPGVFQHDGDPLTEEEKEQLDEMHFQKIAMSDWVYVLDPDQYIGSSTAREIQYARTLGKQVIFFSKEQTNGQA